MAGVNPFQFSTKYTDTETGLVYYGKDRYYQPCEGRWISPDTIGEKGGLNLYAMVNNEPCNAVDYLGMERLTEVFAGLSVTGPEGCPGINYGSYWFNVVKSGAQNALRTNGARANLDLDGQSVAQRFQGDLGFNSGYAYDASMEIWYQWDAIIDKGFWYGQLYVRVHVDHFWSYKQSKTDFNNHQIASFKSSGQTYSLSDSGHFFQPNYPDVTPALNNAVTSAKAFEYTVREKVKGRCATDSEKQSNKHEDELKFKFKQ
jgi:RHS repeat-associated protein